MLANPSRRGLFVLWQALGVLDLLLAVGLGTAARLIEPHGITTNAMSVLPMSLIPTFAVPLLLMLHFICIAQAMGWREQRRTGIAQQVPSAAV
jgi:hypothetical protein